VIILSLRVCNELLSYDPNLTKSPKTRLGEPVLKKLQLPRELKVKVKLNPKKERKKGKSE